MNIADESDKVANFRIKDAQSRRWIALRMRCIRKIANRFEANHRGNFVATRFAATRIDETTHVSAEKIRRLFVHERGETHRVLCGFSCKAPCQREHCSDTAAVIISARRAKH